MAVIVFLDRVMWVKRSNFNSNKLRLNHQSDSKESKQGNKQTNANTGKESSQIVIVDDMNISLMVENISCCTKQNFD